MSGCEGALSGDGNPRMAFGPRRSCLQEVNIPIGQRNASESLTEFVRREGAVTTAAVSHRFGWDTKRAYAELLALRKAGVLVSKQEDRGASTVAVE